ncbi:MAG: EMC6-like membrane protein [Methanosarcinaceae archaeon]
MKNTEKSNSRKKDRKGSTSGSKSDSGASASVSKFKAKTPVEKRADHLHSIVKTAFASFLGVVAGMMAYFMLDSALETKWYAILTIIAILAYYAQRLILPLIKIYPKDFGIKDWLYVEFLVIDFCLVTWTLMLN